MSQFEFSEEAKLYVANHDVVEAMQKRFEASIQQLFDDVGARLRERLSPLPVQQVRSSTTINFYIGDPGDRGAIREPQIWCRWNDVGIVRDELVVFYVTRLECSEDERKRVAAIAGRAELTSMLKPAPQTRLAFFELWIGWEGGRDPAETLADGLAVVLPLLQASR